MRKKLSKAISMILMMAMLLTAFSSMALAAEAVKITTTKSLYITNDVISISGTSPAGADLTLRVLLNDGVVHFDALPAAQNDGEFEFLFQLAELGDYTALVGSGNDVASHNFIVSSPSINGGGIMPLPNAYEIVKGSNEQIVDELKKISELNNDAEKNKLLLRLLEEAAANQDLLATIDNNAQRELATKQQLQSLEQLSQALQAINDVSIASAVVDSLLKAYDAVGKFAQTIQLDVDEEVKQSARSIVEAVLTRTATIVEGQLVVGSADSSTSNVSVPSDVIARHLQLIKSEQQRLEGLLKQYNFATEIQPPTTLSIDLGASGARSNVILSLTAADVALLQSSGMDVDVISNDIIVTVGADALPQSNERTELVQLHILSPEAAQALLEEQAEYTTNILPIRDLKIIAVNKDGSEQVLSDNFQDDVMVSFLFRNTKLSGVDLDKLAVYYYNEAKGKWEIVGAKYNAQNNALQFKPKHFSIYSVVQVNKTFDDIQGRWSQRAIEVAFAKAIVSGKTEQQFDPTSNVTRAEFATMLVNTLGLVGSGEQVFTDVKPGVWYAQAVSAAYESGLVNGVDKQRFAPNEKVTREQMATMIGRALTLYKDVDAATTSDIEALSKFADHAKMSSWADEWIALVVKKGIMNGLSDTTLSPGSEATREQAAKMMLDLFNS